MDISKVARLAHLRLSQQEEIDLGSQLDSILNYFEQISKINTENVEPMISPSENENNLREDVVEKWEKFEDVLVQAPAVAGRLFKVPPVV